MQIKQLEFVADACIFETDSEHMFVICFGNIPKGESRKLLDRVQVIAELENECGIDTSAFNQNILIAKSLFKKQAFSLKQARFIAHNYSNV